MLSQKGLTLTAELKSAMEENVKDTVKLFPERGRG